MTPRAAALRRRCAARAGAAALCLLAAAGSVLPGAAAAHADSVRAAQWHLKTLRIAEAHRISQGEGVTVAVIDTGVDANHPDLRGNVLPGVDSWTGKGNGWQDYKRHGTGTASLIAGHGHGPGSANGVLGIAPRAKILPINVYSPNATRPADTAVASAIKWAVLKGAKVICIALGGGPEPKEEQAVKFARDRGVSIVASAGNRPSDAFVAYPAAYEDVLAVSAVDRNSAFSPISVSGDKIGVAAPGADVTYATPNGAYERGTGTSLAVAIVAGALALLHAKYPNESRLEIGGRLASAADDKGKPGRDDQYGFGVVDVLGALNGEKRATPEASQSTPAAAPSSEPAIASEEAGTPRVGWDVILVLAVLAGLVALGVAGTVFLVLSRKRRATSAAPPPGPPPVGVGADSSTQAQPDAPPPDSDWRRPGGAGSP